METQTGSIDLKGMKKAHDDAEQVATNYLTDITGGGVMVHPDGDSTSGWSISDAIQLLKSGVSYIWAGITNNIATVRVGKEQGGHTVIDENGMRVYGDSTGSTQVANLGYGLGNAQTGTANAPYFTFGTRRSDSVVGNNSVAEGKNVTASGANSHAEGYGTTASGFASHAEGTYATASAEESHAEGYSTTASAEESHAEGRGTTASGANSHAEGLDTTSSGKNSHAEGMDTTASGFASHAGGNGTIAQRMSQTAIGEYNVLDTTGAGSTARGSYAVIVGNGALNARSNALTVAWNGDVVASGDITDGTGNVLSDKANTSSLATVATTGAYSDLSGTPNLATVATTGAYSDLTGTPNLATVATTGAYSDLTGKPTILTTDISNTYAMTTSLKNLYTYTCTRSAVVIATFYPAYGATQPKQARIRVNDTYNMAIASGNTNWENAQCTGVGVVNSGDTIVFACSYKTAGNNIARITIVDIPL